MASICDDCNVGPKGKLPNCRLCSQSHATAIAMMRDDARKRLRDVAAAAWWETDAADSEKTFSRRIRDGVDGQLVEWAFNAAIYYRGLLSLCEAE